MPVPKLFPLQAFVEAARPGRAVQELARWTVVNVDAGESAPFIMGLALAREPQVSGPASIEKREADHAEWLWWLDRSATEEEFVAALLEREGVELEIADVPAANENLPGRTDPPPTSIDPAAPPTAG